MKQTKEIYKQNNIEKADELQWIEKHNDVCRQSGNHQHMLSKNRTLCGVKCTKCGSEFYAFIHSGISYKQYQCKCGQIIKQSTGYHYDG